MRITEDEFEQLVVKALDNLPPEFAERLDNIAVVVEDLADPETLAALEMDDPYDLLGLYQGVPQTERESAFADLPDHVTLYRLAIVSICDTRREVMQEVRDTLVHELGHHFGLSDEDMPY